MEPKWNADAARQQLEWAPKQLKLAIGALKRSVHCIQQGVPENIPGIVDDTLRKMEEVC